MTGAFYENYGMQNRGGVDNMGNMCGEGLGFGFVPPSLVSEFVLPLLYIH